MADTVQYQPSFVQALYGYTGTDSSSLSFQQGDIIEVLTTLESGWWDGIHCDTKVRGWFPSNYVQQISEEEALWAREQTMGWWDADGNAGSGAHERHRTGTSGAVDDMLVRDFSHASIGRRTRHEYEREPESRPVNARLSERRRSNLFLEWGRHLRRDRRCSTGRHCFDAAFSLELDVPEQEVASSIGL